MVFMMLFIILGAYDIFNALCFLKKINQCLFPPLSLKDIKWSSHYKHRGHKSDMLYFYKYK